MSRKSVAPLPAAPVTRGPRSHFFGFHDLCPTNASDGNAVVLGVDFLDRPPGPSDEAAIVVVDMATGEMRTGGRTTAWNFPQGARQQWWPGQNNIYLYNRFEGGNLVAVARDLAGVEQSRIPGGIYCIDATGRRGYSIDFQRLHRLGGYGYAGPGDSSESETCPSDSGIWVYDTATGRRELWLSVARVARELGGGNPHQRGQYLTHVLPSPSGERVCFLHRCWMADGGIDTAVCTCEAGSDSPRILARGYYSHFDWVDESRLLFWGRPRDRLYRARSSGSPVMGRMIRLVRPLWRRAKHWLGRDPAGKASYLEIDVRTGKATPFLPGILAEDGHPTFSRNREGWLVTDTYPDADGWRNLFVANAASGTVHDLGRLDTPRLERRPCDEYLRRTGVGEEAIARHGSWEYFNARSGFSCDFHPRFDRAGRRVLIDSMHTGERQLYAVDVTQLVR